MTVDGAMLPRSRACRRVARAPSREDARSSRRGRVRRIPRHPATARRSKGTCPLRFRERATSATATRRAPRAPAGEPEGAVPARLAGDSELSLPPGGPGQQRSAVIMMPGPPGRVPVTRAGVPVTRTRLRPGRVPVNRAGVPVTRTRLRPGRVPVTRAGVPVTRTRLRPGRVCGGAAVPPGRHPVAGAHTVHVHSIRKDIQPIHKAP
jgi:hypothetical protein